MITKKLDIDDKVITYELSNEVKEVIIFIYHERVKILNVYKFNPSEVWTIKTQHPEDPFIITLHGLQNNKTVNKFNYQMSANGKLDKNCTIVSYRRYDENTDPEEDDDIEIDEIPVITHTDQEHEDEDEEEVFGDEVMVKFKHPIFNSSCQENIFYIQIIGEKFFKISRLENQQIKCCSPLPGRKEFMVELYQVQKEQNDHHYSVLKKIKSKNFITHNTQNDVNKLMEKAKKYKTEKRFEGDHRVNWLYRNKPSHHPTIEEVRRTGIMKKYIKDNSGDPFSSINNQIKALSFSAPDLFTGEVEKQSFYGDYRILIEPKHLFAKMNLYFADFMCMQERKNHWITLVLTKPGSEEDDYCKPRLVKLDINDNPFLYCEESNFNIPHCSNLKIEIIYTEDINIAEMREHGHIQETIVPTQGFGESKPNGIPKTSQCEICNFLM